MVAKLSGGLSFPSDFLLVIAMTVLFGLEL